VDLLDRVRVDVRVVQAGMDRALLQELTDHGAFVCEAGGIAGTRFPLTREVCAHPEYQRRILAADKMLSIGALYRRVRVADHVCDFGMPGCRCPRPRVNNRGMSGVLFFDGACGMCTRTRDLLLKVNWTGDLRTEPLQGAGVAERLGIPPSRLLESVRWLESSGEVYSGAEAANAALSAALGTRLPLLMYRAPGIRAVQEAVYRRVADHRYRFPGTTPYCESHPVAC
jgi:predicted DCC family thiol-disulfide oxidoreductase YuxK